MTQTISMEKKISHFDLVYKDAFKHLVNTLEDYYAPLINRDRITKLLLDYTFIKGEEAVIDLYASIIHAIKYNIYCPLVDVTHDLEHSDEDDHQARTKGYAVKMYGEGFVNYKTTSIS